VKQENNTRPGAWAIKTREPKAPEASQREQIVLVDQNAVELVESSVALAGELVAVQFSTLVLRRVGVNPS
jgi:hypothetical protein